jgi:hypothetical protein
MPPIEDLESRVCIETVPGVKQILYGRVPLRPIKGGVAPFIQFSCEDHVGSRTGGWSLPCVMSD